MIEGGRHPVLDTPHFEPNDIVFNDRTRFILLTGPNMAGKSTYLRQVALITLMAQCGFYVPATLAEIGITDRIFSRIGAGDDLASGRSTFMVEMVETATILNQATAQSLVILDELGRGTSTYDGLSLAWAVTEHLESKIKARCLFATHYFELTELEKQLPTLKNTRMSVKEYDGKILFLHRVEDGSANSSYGLHVAALSGVPQVVLNRAKDILLELSKNPSHVKTERHTQLLLDLAPAHVPPPANSQATAIRDAIIKADLDSLTPIAALNFLSELKKMV
jgi:DNA mismatch repair protein MutS